MGFSPALTPIRLVANTSRLVALGYGWSVGYSDDGIVWTQTNLDTFGNWSGLAWSGSVFCAVGAGSQSAVSASGTTWTEYSCSPFDGYTINGLGHNGTVFCTVAYDSNHAFTSPDGINWTLRSLPAWRNWAAVAVSGSTFVAMADSAGYCATSPDGINWTQRALPASRDWMAVAAGGGKVVALGYGSNKGAVSSDDGSTWSEITLPISGYWRSLAHDGTVFCAIDETSNTGLTSPDGINWTQRALPAGRYAGQLGVLGNWFVFADGAGVDTLTSSNNGLTWTTVPYTGVLPTQYGAPTATLRVQVRRLGQPSATMRIKVYGKGQPSATLRVRVFDPAALVLAGGFGSRVLLGGEDVTERLTGPVVIEGEASAARVATFTLKLAGAFTPASWLNQPVAVDYFKGGCYWRRFTGVVDKPELDFTERTVAFRCTDNLPRRMDDATRAQIDAMTPGALWSRFAFGADSQGWDYLQDRLTTLRASVCLTARGEFSLFGWSAGAVSRTFGPADTQYQTPVLTTAPASQLINRIDLEIRIRRPNLRAADAVWSWRYDGPLNASDLPYFPPSYQVIQDAIADLPSGWSSAGLVMGQIPTVPGYAMSASGALVRRWVQDETDLYTLSVSCPASIATYGELADTDTAAMSIDYDEKSWEEEGRAALADGVDLDPAAEADTLVEIRLAQAARRIADTHRAHRYDFTTLLDPRIELGQTLRVVTPSRSITGQVWKLVDRIDRAGGKAVSEITLAVSFTGVDGAQPDDALTAPTAPGRAATPNYRLGVLGTQVVTVPVSYTTLPTLPDWEIPGWNAELWNTVDASSPTIYSGMRVDGGGHLSFFGTVDESIQLVTGTFSAVKRAEFLLSTPAIDAAYTDHLEPAVSAGYRVAVPNDELIISL